MSRLFPASRGVVLAPVILTLAVTACSREPTPHPPPVAPVTVVKAQTRDMPVLVSVVGTVEPINSVAVTSMIDGQLLSTLVKDGDFVTQNQLLFKIDPRPAQAALRQAQATLTKDKAALGQASSEVKRNAPVAEKGYISADQMEQLRTTGKTAAASVKVDEANVAAARVTLGYTEIRSPLAGRIGRLLIQPGNLLKANDSNALTVINQIEPIFVNFALPGQLLGRVLVAQKDAPLKASATIAGVPTPVDGVVAFVDNAVDTTTGAIKLRAQFANAEHLLWPGQLVGVNLTLGHDKDAIVLPEHAVQNGPDGRYVFVVKSDDSAEQRSVGVARTVQGQAVIQSGLAAGETVVLDGQSRLQNGTKLKIVTSDAADVPPAAQAPGAVP
ncbi:MAG: efflux RND transporter periplasmic adaptor subunit [Rhodanobacter sp.]|jgi:multidrug efflux system membrane fusion protein|nr:efflux RND transporter periplasmic adaptor subunit [Rhodanobacter sp.]